MERKGVPLNLLSLKMLKDRKPVRQSDIPVLLSSPRADRIKRSISPAFIDLQRISMRQKVLSPKASQPSGSPKKLSTLTIPRSRQELMAQYTRQSFDIESIMRHKSPKLSSYKKDAAILLTSSLKKHYNKFFYIWRKHAKDLKKEMIRREALRPTRSAYLTPPLPKSPYRQRSEVESQFSYTYSDTAPDIRKRTGLLSPLSVESDALYVRLKVANRTENLTDVSTLIRKDLSPRAITGISADLYSEEPRAFSSNISRRDVVTETSPVMSPVSDVTGNVIRLIFTLAILLQRRKHLGLISLKVGFRKTEAVRRLFGILSRPILVRMQGLLYALLLGRSPVPRRNALPLAKCIQNVVLRQIWETLRIETIKSMISQMFHMSAQHLSSLILSRLAHAFQCLQMPSDPPLPRKPAITLKTILHIVLMHRLQVAFNAARRYGETQQIEIVTAKTKLRHCFQVCEIARVKLLAKYFNRLRKSSGVRMGENRAFRGRTGAVVGAKVAVQILEQARKRRIWEGLMILTHYVATLRQRQTQLTAILGLFRAFSIKLDESRGELFEVFRTVKRRDRIVRKGKRVLTRMIRMYCKDSALLLRSAYQTWKQLKLLTNPVLAAPEIPMFALIMQGLLRRRVEAGFERLKARLFGMDEGSEISRDKKAAAMAVNLAIGFAVKSRVGSGFLMLKMDEQATLSPRTFAKSLYSGTSVNKTAFEKAKLVAVKLMGKWESSVLKRMAGLSLHQLHLPISLSKGVILLQNVQKHVNLRQWKQAFSVRKQLIRGAELLQIRLRSKLQRYFLTLRPEDSGSSFLDMYAQAEVTPNQALSLRFCLDMLRTNHFLAEMTVLERWKSMDSRREECEMQRLAKLLGGVVRLVHTVRAKTVLLENAAFQSLLIR